MTRTTNQVAAPCDRELLRRMMGAHLRELTSNLIRVVRGAGRPCDIMNQMASVFECLKGFEEDCDDTVRMGDLPSLFCVERDGDVDDLRARAIDDIVNGALQVAASRLVGQAALERQGEQEVLKGIAGYQEAVKHRVW